MSDSLTVFGTSYTGVTGIKAKGTGNGILTYIRPTGTKSITENGTGIDVAAYSTVDVSVSGGGSDLFIVTLSYNDQTELWEPDCTYAEMRTAHSSGKTIIVSADGEYPVSYSINDDPEFNFLYTVYSDIDDASTGTYGVLGSTYQWLSTGIVLSYEVSTYDAYDATATPSDVANGKVFYNSSGRQTGEYAGGGTPSLQSKSVSYTPTESAQSATVTADSGYDGLSSVAVSVGAISSTYVGTGITRRTSSDLTANGATVNVPAGYYASAASKAVATGTAGTPTATKGSVSNHSISVTPSVTNTTGYISGGTKTGTAVTVAASELVSGTLSITSSGTKDVTNYASASVASGGATASATKGAVSNHSITVTPSVTRTAGYVTTGTANGTAVTVSASELVSGSETKTANGTYDVTNLASLVVALDFSTIYTSSSNPSSSQGTNGDIWLVTS